MNDELANSSKFKAWISAMRLRTLPLSFSVILMGSAFAYALPILRFSAEKYEEFDWGVFTLTLLTTLFLQILSNLANDYGDARKGADNEGRIGPERAIQSGILSALEIKVGIIITSFLSLLSGTSLLILAFGTEINFQFILFFIFGVASIAAAIKYTVGNGAYGYYALGDVFVFLFFGILGVCGSFYLQDKEFTWILLLPASQMGFLSVAVLNLNNMRDRVNDERVGKRTLPVILGFEKSKTYHLTLFVLAWLPFMAINIFFLTIIFLKYYGIPFILIAPIIVFHFIHVNKMLKVKDPKAFDPELKKIALSTFLFGLISFLLTIFAR